jgi:hypothetical protein
MSFTHPYLTYESMAEQTVMIIPDFKTAPGQKSALALCRVVKLIFSNRDHDQASVDVLMHFLNDKIRCSWRYFKYEQLADDQVQERIAEFEQYKTPEDLRVRVHAGDVDHDITFTFFIGADEFALEFMPGAYCITFVDYLHRFITVNHVLMSYSLHMTCIINQMCLLISWNTMHVFSSE